MHLRLSVAQAGQLAHLTSEHVLSLVVHAVSGAKGKTPLGSIRPGGGAQ